MGAFRHHRQQAGLVYDLIPPERGSRARPPHRTERAADIVDAEFVTVIPGRGHGKDFRDKAARDAGFRGRGFDEALPPRRVRGGALVSAIAGLRFIETWLQQASRRSFVALIAALAVLVFGLAGGFSGLSATPAPSATEPLQFSHVTLTPRDENGLRVLTLNGIIENQTGATLSVPLVRADLVSGEQLLASIVVDPPVDRIGPHESRGFSTRLQHPGGKTPDIRLSFMP